MIVAGIDEAGYGPVLGPLVVGCTAFQVDIPLDEIERMPEGPCLWKRLSRCVSRNRSKSGRKLHVNDSKLVYSSTGGLKELERSVLALVAAWREWPDGLDRLLDLTASDAVPHLPSYPWYTPRTLEVFPLAQEAMPVRLFANSLREVMAKSSTKCLHIAARVVCERELNRMMDATRNKGSTLFSIAAMHLDLLLKRWGDQDLLIVCDRHGGRARYGALLRLMFERWDLEIISESESCSSYRMRRENADPNEPGVRIIFREKAEAACLPVAYASMLSKYLREAMMHRFNSFWLSELPGVTPTAGYYTDGTRFLGDIHDRRHELGIPDELLIRSR